MAVSSSITSASVSSRRKQGISSSSSSSRVLVFTALSVVLVCTAQFRNLFLMHFYFHQSDEKTLATHHHQHQQQHSGIALPWSVPPSSNSWSTPCNLQSVFEDYSSQIPRLVQSLNQRMAPSIAQHNTTTTKPYHSSAHPFVFFHLRKAGGSSFRKNLHQAAKAYSLESWIPCLNVFCREYILPVRPQLQKAVYGGHLFYSDVSNLKDFKNQRFQFHTFSHPTGSTGTSTGTALQSTTTSNNNNKLQKAQSQNLPPTPNFDCMVRLRPTLSRTVSCWNYRMKMEQNSRLPVAANLTAAEWEAYLPEAFSRYGEGCNHEIVRVFGTIAEEQRVNRFTSYLPSFTEWHHASSVEQAEWQPVLNQQCPVLQQTLHTTLARMSNCVITLLDKCEESKEVLEYYVPWLAPYLNCSTYENVNQKVQHVPTTNGSTNNQQKEGQSEKESSSSGLQDGAEEVILRQNELDEWLYRHAEGLFEEQLRVVRGLVDEKVVDA